MIISANNRFIFTPAIINSANTEIINFHYALLPHYRGMNIPTWVIYNEETQTGITWHYVTEKIDCGKIISQKVIKIGENTTAFDITREGMRLGIEAFKEFIGKLLDTKIDGKEVQYPIDEPIYKNAILPMDGNLNIDESMDKIVRLLHSFDYRGAEIIPKLRMQYKGKNYCVERYSEKDTVYFDKNIIFNNNVLTIQEGGKEIVLILKQLS